MKYFYRTFTGKMIDLNSISIEDIDVRDIAWSLSGIRRFGAHTRLRETVADHSIYMTKKFMDRGEYKNALHALMHDATEAYITDIPSPLKNLIPQIKEFENTIYALIAKKFGLDDELPEVVEKMDKGMIPKEINSFFDLKDQEDEIVLYGDEGYNVFLNLFDELKIYGKVKK